MSTVQGVTPVMTAEALARAILAATPTTTLKPIPMGLSTGTIPADYVNYKTYTGQIGDGKYTSGYTPGIGWGMTPVSATETAPGSGTKRFSYIISASKGAVPPENIRAEAKDMIGRTVLIKGGAIPSGSIFKTKIQGYSTANNMSWGEDGGKRAYAVYTFSPEPPAPTTPYTFYFAPTMTGGSRRRGSRSVRKSSKSKKGTRRH